MDQREQVIVARIRDVHSSTGIPVSDVVSLKFRPTNQNLSGPDKSTFLPASLYGQPSQLEDIEEALMDKIGPQTPAPMKAIKWYGPNRDVLWVPHETGLEIVGAVTGLIGAAASIIAIYEFFRREWRNWN